MRTETDALFFGVLPPCGRPRSRLRERWFFMMAGCANLRSRSRSPAGDPQPTFRLAGDTIAPHRYVQSAVFAVRKMSLQSTYDVNSVF